MRTIERAALAGLAPLFLTACTFVAAPPARNDAAIRSEVTALMQLWSDAGEAGDWDAVADTYADAEGFAWIEQGEVRYGDHAAILEGLAQARENNARIVNDVSDIVVTPLSAGAAAYHAAYTLSVSAEQFSFTSSGVVSGVAVLHEGRWRFLQGAFSERRQ